MIWIPLFVLSVRGFEASDGEFKLEYVRRAGDQFVLESNVAFEKEVDGLLFRSVTHRPKEKLTLSLRWNAKRSLKTADLEHETAAGRQTAKALFDGKSVVVKRPNQKDERLTLGAEPVFATSAPDWSDIMLVMIRYDRAKAGKQQFAGLWLHPKQATIALNVAVEELGKDTIGAGDERRMLGRYRVQLRSGAYIVWADGEGKVFKLTPAGQPQSAVILKGEENSTEGLGGKSSVGR